MSSGVNSWRDGHLRFKNGTRNTDELRCPQFSRMERNLKLDPDSNPVLNNVSMPNRAFWKGRRVFLTGHTGFKGSWLVLWLEALGAEVTAYSLPPPTQPNLFEQATVADSVRSIV